MLVSPVSEGRLTQKALPEVWSQRKYSSLLDKQLNFLTRCRASKVVYIWNRGRKHVETVHKKNPKHTLELTDGHDSLETHNHKSNTAPTWLTAAEGEASQVHQLLTTYILGKLNSQQDFGGISCLCP